MVDANINLLSYEWCNIHKNFCIFSRVILSSQPLINPRMLNKSATALIDDIFINNNYDANVHFGNIVSDNSDHDT